MAIDIVALRQREGKTRTFFTLLVLRKLEQHSAQHAAPGTGDEPYQSGGAHSRVKRLPARWQQNSSPLIQEPKAPAGNGQGDSDGGAYRRMSFRPDYLDDTAPVEQAPATAVAEAKPLPHGDAFFVSVTRDGAAEIHRFDSAIEAQDFVEQQLEDGVGQDDVTAFSGRRLAFNVSHRPIVKLLTQEE